MKQVDQLYQNPEYQACMQKIEQAEQGRIYCKHDLSHFLDVARLMWIQILEQGFSIEKEVVYATALLHDIGRCRQYEDGTAHEKASVKLAEKLLPEAGFSQQQTVQITKAIAAHRKEDATTPLAKLLYRADKAARACYACTAQDTCKWSMEKRNLTIEQ